MYGGRAYMTCNGFQSNALLTELFWLAHDL